MELDKSPHEEKKANKVVPHSIASEAESPLLLKS